MILIDLGWSKSGVQ